MSRADVLEAIERLEGALVTYCGALAVAPRHVAITRQFCIYYGDLLVSAIAAEVDRLRTAPPTVRGSIRRTDLPGGPYHRGYHQAIGELLDLGE